MLNPFYDYRLEIQGLWCESLQKQKYDHRFYLSIYSQGDHKF